MGEPIYPEPVARVFDAVATQLDADSLGSFSAAHIRDIVVRIARTTFPRDARILELGCRTGFLTLALAEAGFRVMAVDASSRLLSILEQSASARRLSSRIEPRVVPDLDPRRLDGTFDAAIVPHGVLNLVGRPAALADALAARLPPHAPLLLDVLNRHHIVELVAFPAIGRFSKGFRKMRGPISIRATRRRPQTVPTQFYSLAEVTLLFEGEFDVRQVFGALISLPPPSLDPVTERMAALRAALARLDDQIRGVARLRALGHHLIVVLERRG